MASHDESCSFNAPTAAESNVTESALPESSWDEGRLLAYMREHDRAIGGLERKTLQHEFCFGAAAQLKYEQLGGKWTGWAKDQGYPLETFRRRRLLYVRAGSLQALDNYTSKMEAYYELGIYRKPTRNDEDALDADWEAKAGGNATAYAGSIPADPPKGVKGSPGAPAEATSRSSLSSRADARNKPDDERPQEIVLRTLETLHADEAEELQVTMPLATVKLLDYLAAQEEAGHGQVIARAVRDYWLRNGDPGRQSTGVTE